MRTQKRYFDEDIRRAEAVLNLAAKEKDKKADPQIVSDLRLSAIGMAIGALDAYLCDAYVDCLTSVLRSYVNGEWKGILPASYAKRALPAGIVLDSSRKHRPLWSLRMAVRKIMERDNVLCIDRVPKLFNGILPDTHKLWAGIVDELLALNSRRFAAFHQWEVAALTGKALAKARKEVIARFQSRLKETIQYRHDWAHNLGWPKTAIHNLTPQQATTRIREVRHFVDVFDRHIEQHRKA